MSLAGHHSLDSSILPSPRTGRQTITEPPYGDKQPFMVDSESAVNLTPTCMSLDRGRKPENKEKTLADTGRAYKLHTGRPWAVGWSKPCCCEATVNCITMPPRWNHVCYYNDNFHFIKKNGFLQSLHYICHHMTDMDVNCDLTWRLLTVRQ